MRQNINNETRLLPSQVFMKADAFPVSKTESLAINLAISTCPQILSFVVVVVVVVIAVVVVKILEIAIFHDLAELGFHP